MGQKLTREKNKTFPKKQPALNTDISDACRNRENINPQIYSMTLKAIHVFLNGCFKLYLLYFLFIKENKVMNQ